MIFFNHIVFFLVNTTPKSPCDCSIVKLFILLGESFSMSITLFVSLLEFLTGIMAIESDLSVDRVPFMLDDKLIDILNISEI